MKHLCKCAIEIPPFVSMKEAERFADTHMLSTGECDSCGGVRMMYVPHKNVNLAIDEVVCRKKRCRECNGSMHSIRHIRGKRQSRVTCPTCVGKGYELEEVQL